MKALRYGLTALTAGVVLVLFWPLLGELRESASLLRRVHLGWLAGALALQTLSYACLASLNHQLLRPFPGRANYWRVLAVLPAMAFIQVAVPSAGASGLVLRARLLGRGGYTVETSTFSLAAESFFEIVVKVLISLAGLWYLLQAGALRPGQLLLAGLAMLLGLTFGFAVWRAALNRARTQRWLMGAQMQWNRLAARLGRQPASRLKMMRRVKHFYAGLDRLRQAPMRGFWLASFSHMALDVASLWACFAAFGYSLPPGTLLTGYGLMLLLSSLSALPGGLGIADASLAVIFARLGAPGAVALAGALLYRLIAFWLLRLIGFVTWQILEARRTTPTPDPTTRWPAA